MKRAKHFPLPTEKLLLAKNLSAAELRLVVSNYYQSQEMRKAADMQLRHLGDKEEMKLNESLGLLTFMADSFSEIEDRVARMIKEHLKENPIALWMQAQRGIGPIIAGGLLAHIDITKAKTAGAIWSFAGLNPEQEWKKGEKRPYNAELKQICWHAGQCFMKQSNDPDCFYGQLYRQRKQFEIQRNEAGGNAERAKIFKVSPGATKAVKDKLKEGKLPDFNIDARARRYAVKIFLSHLHAVWHWHEFKRYAPTPWVIEFGGHVHTLEPPHGHLVPGFIAVRESTVINEAAE